MRQITTDLVVVGGGAAGLLAAVVARRNGLEVVVVESTSHIGGSTATDTGYLWLPGNHWTARAGGADTAERAAEYLDAILGEETEASTAARRAALASTGNALSRWLEDNGISLVPQKGQPDYHADAPGFRRNGRVLASPAYNQRSLGTWAQNIRTSGHGLVLSPRSPKGLLATVAALARQTVSTGKNVVTGGSALVAQRLNQAISGGVLVWLDSPMTDLVTTDGRVTGVLVKREGTELELVANNGVVLAAGGFEASQALREEHLPLPTSSQWTTGHHGNRGVPMMAATRAGARLTLMNEAWWTFVAMFDGIPYRMTIERSMPFGIIVDSAGDRFVNESGFAPEGTFETYIRHRRVKAIPSRLVVDNRHRQNYKMGPWLPGSVPRRDDPAIVRATSLDELASKLGIDRAGLLGSVVRFNQLAAKGTDADFGRGESPHDRAHGDPTRRRNPCLGPLEKSPFWAVDLYPGDTGTKGGLVVDDAARVLDPEGEPIPGLWAVSGTAASVFKSTAPGNGAGLGASLIDAFRAVLDASGVLDQTVL